MSFEKNVLCSHEVFRCDYGCLQPSSLSVASPFDLPGARMPLRLSGEISRGKKNK